MRVFRQRVREPAGREASMTSLADVLGLASHSRPAVQGLAPVQPRVQTKLTVNTPGDAYEQEAEHVADQVMRMPERDGTIQRAVGLSVQRCAACGGESQPGQCTACAAKDEEEHAQAREQPGATPHVSDGTQAAIDDLRGGGQPLDRAARAFLEPRFGHDFSQVRVHTDARAAATAQSVNALAFTVGRDIVFGGGQYQPGSDAGRRLLAHELTHVVQQGSASGAGLQRKEDEDEHDESVPEAEAAEAGEALTLGFDSQEHEGEKPPAQRDDAQIETLLEAVEAESGRPAAPTAREASTDEPGAEPAPEEAVEPIAPISGRGDEERAVAFANGQINLHGRTNATFDGGSFTVRDLVTEPGTECRGCGPRQCVHVTGTIVANYHVVTRVTLPPIPRRPRLTECQREAVQNFIDNVLAPHEQDHVVAFEQYNGTTETPFDLTLCRPRVDQTIRAMFRAEERQRRADARAASAALDPFVRDIEGLDCEDAE
jgi:hypothetical protein